MDEGASQSIFCPEFDCQTLVDDETVIRLVKDSRTKSKYQQLITNSFVQVSLKNKRESDFLRELNDLDDFLEFITEIRMLIRTILFGPFDFL